MPKLRHQFADLSTESLGLLLLLFIGLLFFSLDLLDLRGEEPRRALIAMEMISNGNFIIPHLHGLEYYNKPPLLNWILVGFFQFFGSYEEWVVRLPGILSLVILVSLNYHFVRQYLNQQLALLSSLFFISSIELLFYGSVQSGEIDLFYTLITYLQIITIFHFSHRSSFILLFALSYLFAAIGFLTKGFPSIFHQLISIFIFFIYFKKWKKIFSWEPVLGAFLFVLIVGGYFYVYSQKGGDSVKYILNLIQESNQKSFVKSSLIEILIQIFSFPFLCLVFLLPWSLFLVLFIFKKFKELKTGWPSIIQFCVGFVIANIWVYWLSPGTRTPYLYIFFPFMGIVLAYIVLQYFQGLRKTVFYLLLALLIGRSTYTFIGIPYQQKQISYQAHIDQVLEIVNGAPIDYLNWINSYNLDIDLSGIIVLEKRVEVPLHFRYVIPYLIAKESGQIMQFNSIPEVGQYYITFGHFLVNQKGYTELYNFEENGKPSLYRLVRFEKRKD